MLSNAFNAIFYIAMYDSFMDQWNDRTLPVSNVNLTFQTSVLPVLKCYSIISLLPECLVRGVYKVSGMILHLMAQSKGCQLLHDKIKAGFQLFSFISMQNTHTYVQTLESSINSVLTREQRGWDRSVGVESSCVCIHRTTC